MINKLDKLNLVNKLTLIKLIKLNKYQLLLEIQINQLIESIKLIYQEKNHQFHFKLHILTLFVLYQTQYLVKCGIVSKIQIKNMINLIFIHNILIYIQIHKIIFKNIQVEDIYIK